MLDLDGNYIEDNHAYAKRVILEGLRRPPIHVHVSWINFDDKGIGLTYHQYYGKIPGVELEHAGIYCLFDGYPSKTNCLYVGCSRSSIEYRVYRFMKELCNVSKNGSGHPGARRARLYGKIKFDDIWLKRIHMDDFPKTNNKSINFLKIDEHVASILGSRFNKRVKHG